MMTDDEIIAVVQAHKEGKQIQIRMGAEWVDSWPPVWNFTYDYRVAPEPRKPREFWLTKFSETNFFVTCDPDKNPGAFRVQEVIE